MKDLYFSLLLVPILHISTSTSLGLVEEESQRLAVSQRLFSFRAGGNKIYGPWSHWSRCTRSCTKKRYRGCVDSNKKRKCKKTRLYQERPCRIKGTKCWYDDKSADWKKCAKSCRKKWHYKKCLEWCNELNPGPEKCGGNDCDSGTSPRPKITTTQTSESKITNEIAITTKSPLETTEPGTETETGTGRRSCGKRPNVRVKRIVGGRFATRGSWPWQVALVNRWREQYCGGTLIHPLWILTAAHCVFKRGRQRHFTIRFGEFDLLFVEGSELEIRSDKIIPHPDYHEKSIYADIALVKLEHKVRENEYMSTACMNSANKELLESDCYVVGWGKEKHTHIFGSNVLKEVKVEVQKHETCQKAFEFDIEKESEICAGGAGTDACEGDSGGGLVCRNGGRWYVEGVTSYGEGCGDEGKFGIYTSVNAFQSWIDDTIKNE